MPSIHEMKKNTNRANKIRAAMILKSLTVRKWALDHGYKYTTVNAVVSGTGWILEKPDTVFGKIQQDLVAEGFWPTDEEIS